MKKLLLKAMAIMAVMGICSANAMAADPDLANDYTLVKSFTSGVAAEENITLSSTSVGYKVNNVDVFPVSSPEGYEWIAFQGMSNRPSGGTGNGWWNRSGYGLYSIGAGRSASINYSDLTTGWIVVFNCTQTASNVITMVENASLYSLATSTDGKSVFATIVAASDAHVDFAGNKNGGYISSIAIYKPNKAVETAKYTINYLLGEDTVKIVSESALVGSTVKTLQSFFNENDAKFIRVADETESFELKADTSVIVKVRDAEIFNCTLKDNYDNVVCNVSGYEGETVYAPYPRYNIITENTLYEAAVTNKEYRIPVELVENDMTATVTYTAKEGITPVFNIEGEDIVGVEVSTYGNIPVRGSNAQAGVSSADVQITTLPVGKYTITAGVFTSKTSAQNIVIGVGDETFTASSAGNLTETTSTEFVVKANGTPIVYKGSESSEDAQLDYIYIAKTGDYKYLDVESALPDTLSYVKGTPEDEKPKLSDYIKVSTNAIKTGAAFYAAKVEAGADKAAVTYTAYESEDAAKAAMSEPGLYYCFGRIVGLFSMTDINDYKEAYTDTIVVEVKEAEAEPVSAHTWDFTQWSDATITNLKAEAAKVTVTPQATEGVTRCENNDATWSDHEKAPGKDCTTYAASKDNCFWFFGSANADGQLEANGEVIEELSGLTFPTTAYNSARSIAIAVNYGSTSLGEYAGGSYVWLGGSDKDCFVIKNVKAGSVITIGVESHKLNPADARGVKLMLDGTELKDPEGNAVAAPTVYAEQTWQVPYPASALSAKGGALSADADDEVVDITVHNTNGCHIYFIDAEIGELTPDAIQTVEAETEAVKAVKFIKDGKLIIVSGGKQFNAAGAQVK